MSALSVTHRISNIMVLAASDRLADISRRYSCRYSLKPSFKITTSCLYYLVRLVKSPDKKLWTSTSLFHPW